MVCSHHHGAIQLQPRFVSCIALLGGSAPSFLSRWRCWVRRVQPSNAICRRDGNATPPSTYRRIPRTAGRHTWPSTISTWFFKSSQPDASLESEAFQGYPHDERAGPLQWCVTPPTRDTEWGVPIPPSGTDETRWARRTPCEQLSQPPVRPGHPFPSLPHARLTLGISCEPPIRSGFVSFIPLFGGAATTVSRCKVTAGPPSREHQG